MLQSQVFALLYNSHDLFSCYDQSLCPGALWWIVPPLTSTVPFAKSNGQVSFSLLLELPAVVAHLLLSWNFFILVSVTLYISKIFFCFIDLFFWLLLFFWRLSFAALQGLVFIFPLSVFAHQLLLSSFRALSISSYSFMNFRLMWIIFFYQNLYLQPWSFPEFQHSMCYCLQHHFNWM